VIAAVLTKPFALVAGFAVLLAACSSRPPDDANYVGDIKAARQTKDATFQKESSPVPDNRKSAFLPLAYFPIDPAYSVPAVLKPAAPAESAAGRDNADAAVIEMPTSTGQKRQMRRVGRLEFSLKGQPLHLTAFVEVGARDLARLFVPFSDVTTGTETYAAGRYLDLDRNATGIYVIDFNKAYHPYCYYNPTFDCPYPPAENRLPIPVRAGERLKETNR
jgi:uncharacterized protein (DUF1684 family)